VVEVKREIVEAVMPEAKEVAQRAAAAVVDTERRDMR
jgi:hypothetical protein